MDKAESNALIETEIARLKAMGYRELTRYIENQENKEVTGSAGKSYQMEVLAVWDSRPEGDLRVFVSIDDGGLLRAIFPKTKSFIVAPDGALVGE